jgi:alkylated DNA repair dioxygenase AlkB
VAAHLGLDPARFVHVLVSEYRPGTPIGWHRDKPQYGIVVGISLAAWAHAWRPYAHQDAQHTFSLDLARRSMYVMRGPDPVAVAAQHARHARACATRSRCGPVDRRGARV